MPLTTIFLFFLTTSILSTSSFFSPQPTTIRYHPDRSHTTTIRRMMGWFDNLFPKLEDDPEDYTTDRKRLYPEQYPATYDLLVVDEPLPGDEGEEATLVRPLLKQTQLERRAIKIAYDANRHGWSARAFHNAVDGKGAAVVLAKKDDEKVVGGYNPKGWSSLGGARPSVAAFLFYQTESTSKFQKLRKVGGGGLACSRDDPDFGISLGADGLVIGLQPGEKERWAQSKLGPYYERGPEDLYSLFPPSGGCNLVDLKVLVGKYESGEEIPYSGAVLDMTSG